jgi:HSP20 family molecular chaperone IbpA
MEAEPNSTQEKELGIDEGEVYSREDRQGNSVAESGSNAISASQFQELMKEFREVKSSIKAVSEMTNKIEMSNNILAERLTKQFRDEHENLRKEISNKVRSEISNLSANMDKLSKDTEHEVLDISHRVDLTREQLNVKIEKEMGVTHDQLKQVSQEITTKTRELTVSLTEYVTQTEIDSGVIRTEIVESADRVNRRVTAEVKMVTDSIEDCKNQAIAEKKMNALKLQKLEQEIDHKRYTSGKASR